MKRKPKFSDMRVTLPADKDDPMGELEFTEVHRRLRVECAGLKLEIVYDRERKAVKFYEVSSKRLSISPCAANAFTLSGTRI